MKSMTGFGRSKININQREYCVEIKSVNHKYSDITIKLPRNISYLEEIIKKEISNNLSRGKVDVFVSFYDYGMEQKNLIINRNLAKAYINELKSLAEETDIKINLQVENICNLPDVMKIQNTEDDEKEIAGEMLICVSNAIKSLNTMKITEGEKIKLDLITRINKIKDMVFKISEYSTGLIEEYVVKLKERINKFNITDLTDDTRIAQETVIYSDKCSIEEEVTRLKSHIEQFKGLLNVEYPIGKKLDFLIQEMNRETNTIGSKSVKLEITNLVIEIKTELENIREQIQNIE